jgi:hypothetical protein
MDAHREIHMDPHDLFFTSQNERLEHAIRDQAEQELQLLSFGYVHVPPPTVQVTAPENLAPNFDESQGTAGGQASSNASGPTAGQSTTSRRKGRIKKNRPRRPLVIPPGAEIIIISSDSERESGPVKLAIWKPRVRRPIYHPKNHTSDAWRCPVTRCTRHDPEFGFPNNAQVERHLRNRHPNELVYPCISGCSNVFENGREWARHHRDFHAEVAK